MFSSCNSNTIFLYSENNIGMMKRYNVTNDE